MKGMLSAAGLALAPGALGPARAATTQDMAADVVITGGGRTVESMKLYPGKREYTERPLDAKIASQDPAMDPPGTRGN